MAELLSLEIENFRSFHKAQAIEFGEAANRGVTALYGANAGGKSNVVKALKALFACIAQSSAANWKLPYEPFALNVNSPTEPTRFKIIFLSNNRRFAYELSFNRDKVVGESLKEQSKNSKKEKTIFERSADGCLNSTAAKNRFGKRLLNKTRPDTLLITKAREDNNEFANTVFNLLASTTIVGDESGPVPGDSGFVEMLKNDPVLKDRTVALLNKCDIAIRGIEIKNVPLPEGFFESFPVDFPSPIKQDLMNRGATEIKTIHAIRDDEGSVVGQHAFDFLPMESMGTKKFFEVVVPIIDALDNGKTLLIDEFSSYIHPNLAGTIVRMFKERSSDCNGSKLVLITHNTAMMSDLSREEIFLVEKTLGEESRIVPLSKAGARKGDSFEKRYRSGYYGGVPLIVE